MSDLVGLVVVSHSRALAEAALELALQMVHVEGLRTAVAAGMDDGSLGTDAMAIAAALQQVDGPAGVVVLMDLGSAVLSAELALDLADDDTLRARVLLSSAPLVEGLVVAAVSAASGATREQVAAEAANALAGKRSSLGDEPEPTTGPPVASPLDGETVSAEIELRLPHGLHARPVAKVVAALHGLDARVTLTDLTTGSGPAAATSPTQVTLLGALHGHRLRVDAAGPDARAALRALVDLATRDFDETVPLDPGPGRGRPPVEAAPSGAVGASPGVVVGPVRHLRSAAPDLSRAPAASDDPLGEIAHLAAAVDVVRAELARLHEEAAREVGADDAAIFEAHAAILDDTTLQGDARARIQSGASAVEGWQGAVTAVEQRFAALDDAYLAARGADVRAVGDQVLTALVGGDLVAPQPSGVGVLVADDLTPAQTSGLDPAVVQGIVLARGSRTSHAAILARARGIPAVVGAGAPVLDLAEGAVVALDGDTGSLVVDPDQQVVSDHLARATVQAAARATALASSGAAATTRDGRTVVVACNVGSLDDARAGAAQGADGSGLVRTELCFVGRADEPDVDEQQALYLAVAQALGGKRITLRTLDVGGDKPLPYLPVDREDNPFLGVRGLRLGLVREPVLRRQLLAVVRTARQTPVSLMFPMVTTRDELVRARRLLDDVLAGEGPAPDLEVGIMVEVPAVALKLAALADLLDFVSIGTNDLTQYAMAAERGNPGVAQLSDPLDPGVLALIAATTSAAQGRFQVALCGEAGSDPVAVPVLLGLGVDELSVSPYAVPGVKELVRTLSMPDCRALAQDALAAPSAAAVRELSAARS